jgi:hypothetical protein
MKFFQLGLDTRIVQSYNRETFHLGNDPSSEAAIAAASVGSMRASMERK